MAYPAPIPVIEKPDLSIIVPVFQESRTLPPLFLMLSKQEQVSFELLLADGGSSDDTVEKAVLLQKKYPFQTRVLNSKKGRGRQMNTAGNVAKADTLLFLHADSFFLSPLALFQGLRELENAMSASLARDIAGRFSLSFHHEAEYTLSEKLSLAYYYYENKAHLNRTE
ncbi:MAG: glycosyltransferase, partial [Nitrospinota bacterium]